MFYIGFNRESIKQYIHRVVASPSATLPSLFKLWPLVLYIFFTANIKKILSETKWPNAIIFSM